MDDPLRHWPLFVTGLLLGATGAMSLGLHRPTDIERAAAARAPVVVPATATAVAAAAPAPVATAGPQAGSVETIEDKMRAAAEAFRAQEAAAPYALALAQPPKPKVHRVVKEPDPQESVAIAPNPAPEAAEPPARLRAPTSTMGAAAAPEKVEAARGSARAPETGEPRPQPE